MSMAMWAFWIIAVGLAAVAGGFIWRALLGGGVGHDAVASDIRVYKDQLKDVDRDLARGVITEDQANALRLEVSRRLLAADKAGTLSRADGDTSSGGGAVLGGVLLAVLVGSSAGLYALMGAPGYSDMPLSARIADAEALRADRPSQSEAEAIAGLPPPVVPEAEFAALMERLRAATAERPDDLEGFTLLARNERRLGNLAAAARAYERIVEIKGADSTPRELAALADALILATGGYVSPEAEAVLARLAEADPANGVGRYYTGLMLAQIGRPDQAFRIWRVLLETSAPDASWIPPLRAQIGHLAQLAGVDYVVPGAVSRGPTEEDIEAAGEMTPSERMEMIRGMVASLSDRLATEGGPPEDWARLIRSLGVIGERDRAAAIWAEAQQVFPDPVVQLPILDAARDAGVAE